MHPVLDLPQFEPVRVAAQAVHAAGGRAILVGGAVRDSILGLPPKDFDIEVFGVPEGSIEPLLKHSFEHVIRVGRSFPVWKAGSAGMGMDEAFDFALPRREVKVGDRHTDFVTILDPGMSFEDASSRRDFTMNAVGIDILTGDVMDPHGGLKDIENKTLRHVSDHFAEDPLRVLRGMQFCARFGLKASPETVAICSKLTPEQISAERQWGEFSKLVTKGVVPSAGLNFLRACGWTSFYPELKAIEDVPQEPSWHPEGDVWVHTGHCLDAFAEKKVGVEREDLIVGMAVLCHDLGKATTTKFEDGKIKAHGHEAAGGAPTRSFLGRLTSETDLINDVVALVVHHMTPGNLYDLAQARQNVDRQVRRLSTAVRLDRLARVCYADSAGRPPKPKYSKNAVWLSEAVQRLAVEQAKPKPLVMGRDLIAAGQAPSPTWGRITKLVYEKQLDGVLTTHADALEYALSLLKEKDVPAKEAPAAPSI